MAEKLSSEFRNSPTDEEVRDAVAAIEACYGELLSERMAYMGRCKQIRQRMSGQYDIAAEKGIPRKALKLKVKERELERKIDALTEDLEPEEQDSFEMISAKLGDFANTPLGQAALDRAPRAEGGQSQQSMTA